MSQFSYDSPSRVMRLSLLRRGLCALFLPLLLVFSAAAIAQPMPPCYHTRAAIDTALEALEIADSTLNIFRVDTIGYSRGQHLGEPYPIYCVKVSDNVDVFEDEPTVLIIAHIHAEEMMGVEVVFELLHRMISMYGLYAELIESTQLYFVPTMNPDGLEVVSRGWDNHYRKNGYKPPELLDRACSVVPGVGRDSCGVDLNRNFGLNWIYGDTLWQWQAGTLEPYDYYRGPAPFSEPESQAIRDLALQIKPTLSAVYHSSYTGTFSEYGFAAWKWGSDPGPYKFPPDCTAIGSFNRLYCGHLLRQGTSGSTFSATFGGTHNGCLHDWFYWKLGTLQILTEFGPPEMTQPPCSTLQRLKTGNYLDAVTWFLKRATNFDQDGPTPLTIYTKDAATQLPISAQWCLINASNPQAWNPLFEPWYTNEEYGAATTLLAPPGNVQVVARKYGYVADTVSTTINPNSFPRIVTLELAPLPYHSVMLNVRDGSGSLIPATIHADNGFQQTLTLSTGTETVWMPEGNYRLMCVPNDQNRMVLWQNAFVGADTIIEFGCGGATEIWSEYFENGLTGWTAGGNASPWRVETAPASPFSQSLCFAPEGYHTEYANDLDCWLTTTQTVNLNSGNAAFLSFYREGRLDEPTDSVIVEVSTDGGSTWEHADGYSDLEVPWTMTYVDLTPWMSHSILFRLHLKTDFAVGELGLHIDNLRIFSGSGSDADEAPQGIAFSYRITGAYPNPFNSATTIAYEIAAPGRVKLSIFNLLGEEVRSFEVNPQSAGAYKLVWDGSSQGRAAATGLYFVRMQSADAQSVHKLLLLR